MQTQISVDIHGLPFLQYNAAQSAHQEQKERAHRLERPTMRALLHDQPGIVLLDLARGCEQLSGLG